MEHRVGDASTSSNSPTEATYVTHLIGNPKNTSSWHAQEDISGQLGWYKFEVTSYAPSCWYAGGKRHLGLAGSCGLRSSRRLPRGVAVRREHPLQVCQRLGAGEMFVTLVPTTMSGNPRKLIGHRPRPKPCEPLHGLQRFTTGCHPAYKAPTAPRRGQRSGNLQRTGG